MGLFLMISGSLLLPVGFLRQRDFHVFLIVSVYLQVLVGRCMGLLLLLLLPGMVSYL
jgi:hypothetical protein